MKYTSNRREIFLMKVLSVDINYYLDRKVISDYDATFSRF